MAVTNPELLHSLGMRIRYLRRERNMSILDLSLEADVNRNYISDLERGKRNPTIEVLFKISNALNITLSNLLSGIDISL
ncbi:MAG: helix-turn-helix domain-containing protein [Coprobacillus sp.]|nr:helix-turn-helix domain-containing protein [Coprobacillus sp.]